MPTGLGFLVGLRDGSSGRCPLVAARMLDCLPCLRHFVLILRAIKRCLPRRVTDAFGLSVGAINFTLSTRGVGVREVLDLVGRASASCASFVRLLGGNRSRVSFPMRIGGRTCAIVGGVTKPVREGGGELVVEVYTMVLSLVVLANNVIRVMVGSGGTAASNNSGSRDSATSDALVARPIVRLSRATACCTSVRVRGCNAIAMGLSRSTTPIAMSGFVGLTRGNFCGKLAFRHVVRNFVVRNNSPGNGNANNGASTLKGRVGVINRFRGGNCRGALSRATNTVSVTHTARCSATSSRFFVIRASSCMSDLSKRCTTFNYMDRNVSVIGGVYRTRCAVSRGRAVTTTRRPIVGLVAVEARARRDW